MNPISSEYSAILVYQNLPNLPNNIFHSFDGIFILVNAVIRNELIIYVVYYIMKEGIDLCLC